MMSVTLDGQNQWTKIEDKNQKITSYMPHSQVWKHLNIDIHKE